MSENTCEGCGAHWMQKCTCNYIYSQSDSSGAKSETPTSDLTNCMLCKLKDNKIKQLESLLEESFEVVKLMPKCCEYSVFCVYCIDFNTCKILKMIDKIEQMKKDNND